MAPKRRGGRKATSQSHPKSQSRTRSHSHSQPDRISQVDASPSQAASYFQSSLPPPEQRRVTVAVLPREIPLVEARVRALQQAGGEAIEDGWRREDREEGRIEVRWDGARARKRKISHKGVEVSAAEGEDDQATWHTAALAIPCSCQLPRYSRGYQPHYPPPLASELHILPVHDEISERPLPTHELPEWNHFVRGSEASMTDLDPSLDDIKEFEMAWRDADGGWGRGWGCEPAREEPVAGPSGVQRDKNGVMVPHRPAADAIPRDKSGRPLALEPSEWWKEFDVAATQAETELAKDARKESPVANVKGRAPRPITMAFRPQVPLRMGRERPLSTLVSPQRSAPPTTSKMAETGETCISETGSKAAVDWQAESKRRTQIWRGMIEADDNYGKMWKVIKVPRYIEPPAVSSSSTAQPQILSNYVDFKLPRALSRVQHPFHPSLPHYISRHPSARIYWLVPINGPVHIPGVNSLPLSASTTHALAPSSASLADTQPFVDPLARPFPLLWTPPLLQEFMSQLIKAYKHPSQEFGSISIRLSGPKPDAYIDLPTPPPPSAHDYLPSSSPPVTPVRPECGDHIRIYVDARYCLAFRTWLYSVNIPWAEMGDHAIRHAHDREALMGSSSLLNRGSSAVVDTQMEGMSRAKGSKAAGVKVFNKVRLALVGEMGEVLIVA